jgi:flagellar protein FlbD
LIREPFWKTRLSLEVPVIAVTKLNGEQFMVNAELVELVESTPDTIVSLTTGKKYMVRETIDEIVDRIIQYRRQISPFFDTDAG